MRLIVYESVLYTRETVILYLPKYGCDEDLLIKIYVYYLLYLLFGVGFLNGSDAFSHKVLQNVRKLTNVALCPTYCETILNKVPSAAVKNTGKCTLQKDNMWNSKYYLWPFDPSIIYK